MEDHWTNEEIEQLLKAWENEDITKVRYMLDVKMVSVFRLHRERTEERAQTGPSSPEGT